MPHALLYCYAAQNQARPSAAGYHHAHISAAITATRTLHLSKRYLGDYSVLIGGVLRWTGWRVLALVLGPKAGLLHCQCHQSTTGVGQQEEDLQLPAIQAPEHHEKHKEPDQNDAHGQNSAKGLQTLALKADGESFGCCYLPPPGYQLILPLHLSDGMGDIPGPCLETQTRTTSSETASCSGARARHTSRATRPTRGRTRC